MKNKKPALGVPSAGFAGVGETPGCDQYSFLGSCMLRTRL
jgi:hypothetical protein